MFILEYKDGVKPAELSPKAKANMERCANFLVEMIEKYGNAYTAAAAVKTAFRMADDPCITFAYSQFKTVAPQNPRFYFRC